MAQYFIGIYIKIVTIFYFYKVPYLPLEPSLWLTVPSLATLGAGQAAVQVAAYSSCLEATLSLPGYSESDATYSLGENKDMVKMNQ